ncbi:MAG: hypothetical protein KJO07_07165, partial [Deltaproteobacteria bacterium]|nr:hypothetical protein [Deltaproteobacteria bacterium]
LVAVTTYDTEDYPDEASWTLALQQAGLDVVEGRAEGRGPEGEQFFYQVRHRGGPAAVERLLRDKDINAARAEPVVREHRAKLGDMDASQAGLAPPGKDPVAWSSMDLVRLVAPYPLRGGAKVVIATDRPQDYWHVLPLIIVLFVAALFFGFLLAKPLWQLARKSPDGTDA